MKLVQGPDEVSVHRNRAAIRSHVIEDPTRLCDGLPAAAFQFFEMHELVAWCAWHVGPSG
jgi:hypothetical protein